ncbi:MAG: hypothetical protein ABJQ21_20130 [Roseibium sp.]
MKLRQNHQQFLTQLLRLVHEIRWRHIVENAQMGLVQLPLRPDSAEDNMQHQKTSLDYGLRRRRMY